MDRRIETLVRRDQNGRPLPPTQAEITNWSANYGAAKATAAVREIQDIQAKARAEEQSAGDNALKQEQARAAIEAAKTQAVIAKQKADQEAAAQGAQTEKTRLANERVANKQKAEEDYRHGALGQGMSALEGASPPAGVYGGFKLSSGINKVQENSRKNANAERQNIASDFDKINPQTATAAEYESIPRAARQANVIPKIGASANFTRGIGRYSPYAGIGGFMAGEGALQRYLANSNDDMDPFVKDAFNTTGAAMMGAGLGTMGKGLVYAGSPTERPDTSALRKIATAEGKAKELTSGREAEQVSPPPAPVEPYKGNPKDVARYIAHDLGLTPNAKDTKADLITNALGQIKSGNATQEQVDLVTQRARGVDPETVLGRIAKSNKPLAVILGALGLGAGAAMEPDEAEAASVMPGVHEPANSINSRPSRGQEAVDKALGVAKNIGKAAPYAVPGVGEALAARDLAGVTEDAPSTPRPKAARVEEGAAAMRQDFDRMQGDANLAAAQQKDARQRAEMEPKPEPIGAEAAHAVPSEVGPGIDRRVGRGTVGTEETHKSAFVNPEQHTFDPEHLPEHERSFLDNPAEAHERSKWLIPYLRAGSEAQKRGEDFFGGSDQYERELGALKHFYHGQQAPVAPEAPTEEEAPIGRKHGGSVNRKSKQINSIHDTFKHKLADKERLISSLEKAIERKPNAKLSKRLAKEKSEAQRIHEHLEKIMAHG